jgi:hypothetical protein
MANQLTALAGNPKRRNVILLSAIAAIIVCSAALAFLLKKPKPAPVPFATQPTVQPGSIAAGMQDNPAANNPEYEKLAHDTEIARAKDAQAAGQNYQPDFVGNPQSGQVNRGVTYVNSGALVPQPQTGYAVAQPVVYQAPPAPQYQQQQNYDQGGSKAIEQALKIIQPTELKAVLSDPQPATQTASSSNTNANGSPLASNATGPVGTTILHKGDLGAAQVLTRLNSDIDSPVLAVMVSGPYQGAKLLGKFTRVNEVIKPVFDSMSIPGIEKSLTIEAIALDADTTEAGIASDVDNHIFLKYGLKPAAAAFSALGQALAASNTTTVASAGGIVSSQSPLNGRQAIGTFVGGAATQYNQDITSKDTDPTVTVNRNTLIGVLFTKDVVLPANT